MLPYCGLAKLGNDAALQRILDKTSAFRVPFLHLREQDSVIACIRFWLFLVSSVKCLHAAWLR